MLNGLDEAGRHPRPHPQVMAAPFLEFDLARELDQLRREPEWSKGHNARTLAKYDDFRIVLAALKAGAHLPAHQADGRISVQTLTGHIKMRAEGRTFDLPVGRLLTLDRALTHDVEALEESAFLLTIAWHGHR
jgi:quercetin dioxygenase-like cupin family protein